MPIRLNLLSEFQAAEDARRRDPVRRAILGGVILVAAVLGWSSFLQLRVIKANSDVSGVESRWKHIEKDYQFVLDQKRKIAESEERLVALQRITTNRFLWGSALNELQHVLTGTEGISITRLRGEQQFTQIPEVKASKGGAKGGPVAAKPASSVEKIILMLDARDTSAQAGDQVEKVKSSLGTPIIPGTAAPSAPTSLVSLLNISAPQTDQAGVSFVNFTLQATYPERTRQ